MLYGVTRQSHSRRQKYCMIMVLKPFISQIHEALYEGVDHLLDISDEAQNHILENLIPK